jgi:DNA-binding IclR family transcriptional regulator
MTIETAAAEAAVLTHLLNEHPRRMSLQDLSQEVAGGMDGPTVERAIDNLTAACLLRLDGSIVVPAPAVVSFDRNHPAPA